MTPEDRGLCAVPLFHCFGQNFIMNALVTAGGTLVLHERFVPAEYVGALTRHGITLLYGVPTMYILFLSQDEPLDLSSIRLCFSAAATLLVDVERSWYERYGHRTHPGLRAHRVLALRVLEPRRGRPARVRGHAHRREGGRCHRSA
jgi:long-chain acyl-CoA synthetase